MSIDPDVLSLIFGFITIFAIMSLVAYRLLSKFDETIPLWQIFIPVWGIYLLAKQITTRPAIFVGTLYLSVFLIPVVQTYYWLLLSLQITQGLLMGYMFGHFARRLGKNFWLHAFLGFFWLPILITAPIMALDSSKPQKQL